MIEIIPAIDIIDGKCVRLTKGDYDRKKVYDASPVDMAKSYADCGVKRVHLVDLDGAKAGRPVNLATLEKIASQADMEIEWGGGISSSSALDAVFSAGATHAIAGSIAVTGPEVFTGWIRDYGGRIILGADIKDGNIAIRGWQETAALKIEDLLKRYEVYGIKEAVVTDVSRDGMLHGPSFDLYSRLQEDFPHISFTISGGISSMDDIRELDRRSLRKVIVGKAIYENRISLKDIESWLQNA